MRSGFLLIVVVTLLLLGTSTVRSQTTTQSFSNSGQLTIENNQSGPSQGSPYPFDITVSGMNGAVSGVNVTLNGFTVGSGSVASDAALMLVAPNGSALVFFAGVCGEGEYEPNNLNITLSDSGSAFPPNGSYSSQCASATYKPYVNEELSTGTAGVCVASEFPSPANQNAACANNPGGTATFASAFGGVTPNGTWKIYAYDIAGTDISSITSGVTLTITTELSQSATTTSVTVSETQAFTTSPSNTETYTAAVTSGGGSVSEGVVQFYDNGLAIGAPVAVSAGQATYDEIFSASTPEGAHNITATYTDTASNPKYETSNNNSSPAQVFLDNHTVVSNGGTTFCNPGALTVQNSGATSPYPQHVFVSGLSGGLASVTLTFNDVTTSYGLSDWKVLLVGPDGTSFAPMAYAGGYRSESGLTFSLTDTGSSLLDPGTDNTSPSQNGTYLPTAYQQSSPFLWPAPAPQAGYNYPQPQGTATFAATFASENLDSSTQNGQTWSLYLSDQAGDSDTVAGGYCLAFTVNNGVATATTVSAIPNPAITDSQVTLTAHVTANSGVTNVTGGSVKFEQQGNPTPLGSASTDGNGNASITFTPTSEGLYNITAIYSGQSGSYNQSQGTTALQVDNQTTVNGTSFCNPGPISITAQTNHTPQQYPSRVLVSNVAGVVSGVTLTLDDVTYSYAQDLAMMLTGPSVSNNIVFWGNIGGSGAISNQSFTIADGESSLPQGSTPSAGTYAPTVFNTPYSLTFPATAPSNPNFAAPTGTATLSGQFHNVNPNGYWDFYVIEPGVGGDTGSIGQQCVNLTITPPALAITKSHTGSFTQGDSSDVYSITVTNNGPGSTAGTMTMTDTLPAGLAAVSLIETANSNGGSLKDWTCSPSTAMCTRTSTMPQGETDTFALTVSVGYGTATGTNAVTNSVQVSGGGASNSPTANDQTTINPGQVQVTFGTTPNGLSYTVDGTSYSAGTTLSFTDGSMHTVSTTSPQGTSGTRYTFANWSDGGAQSHQITVSSTNGNASYTASFNPSYLLTTAANPTIGGAVGANPASPTSDGYYPAGTQVQLTATPNPTYTFSSWSGSNPRDLSSTSTNPTTLTMNGPETVTATFALAYVPISGQVAVTETGLLYSPALANPGSPGSPGGGTTTFTITNTSGATITGPIQLVLTNLPAGVTGSNNAGIFNGSPYWNVPNSGSLAAGASVQVTVQLNYLTTTAVSTSPALYTGSL